MEYFYLSISVTHFYYFVVLYLNSCYFQINITNRMVPRFFFFFSIEFNYFLYCYFIVVIIFTAPNNIDRNSKVVAKKMKRKEKKNLIKILTAFKIFQIFFFFCVTNFSIEIRKRRNENHRDNHPHYMFSMLCTLLGEQAWIRLVYTQMML